MKFLCIIILSLFFSSCSLNPVFSKSDFSENIKRELSAIKLEFDNTHELYLLKRSISKIFLSDNLSNKKYIINAKIIKTIEGIAVNELGIETRRRLHLTLIYELKNMEGKILLSKPHSFFTDFAIDSYHYSSVTFEDKMLKSGIEYLANILRNDLISYFSKNSSNYK